MNADDAKGGHLFVLSDYDDTIIILLKREDAHYIDALTKALDSEHQRLAFWACVKIEDITHGLDEVEVFPKGIDLLYGLLRYPRYIEVWAPLYPIIMREWNKETDDPPSTETEKQGALRQLKAAYEETS